MLKYYVTFLFQQFTKTLTHFFYLSSASENLETYIPVYLNNWKNKSNFDLLSLDNTLIII